MPPPRRRPRLQLSAYDRELLQAVNDRRLDRDDPEVQAVLRRLEQAPGLEPWQTADVRVQPEAPPPPSSFEADVALTRAGQAGREGVVSMLPRPYSVLDEPADASSRPDPYTMRSLGRDVVEHAAVPVWNRLNQPAGENPYSPAMQDRLREQGCCMTWRLARQIQTFLTWCITRRRGGPQWKRVALGRGCSAPPPWRISCLVPRTWSFLAPPRPRASWEWPWAPGVQ